MGSKKIVERYAEFECESLGVVRVDVVATDNAEIDCENVSRIEHYWPKLWPVAHDCLQRMRSRYEFNPEISGSDTTLKLMLPDVVIDGDQNWEISVIVQSDGYGEWGIGFDGWVHSPDISQPYF